MRADRLLSILIELQLHGTSTAEHLARRFAVSRRTIYRDIDALDTIGVPVYADRGPGGGIRLVDGYRTRLTGMSQPETEALMLIGLAAPAADLGLAEHAASARLKLLASLPPQATDAALRVGERFHLDPVDWYRRAPATPPLLGTVSQAVWRGHRLSIDYESWEVRGHRVVEPLGLVMKAAQWYLVARARTRLRTYRVDHIRDATVLDEPFAHPRGFDLAAHWKREVARFEASLRVEEATLRVAPAALSRIAELGADIAEAVLAASPDAEGHRVAVVPYESDDYLAPRLLAFVDRIEVLKPVRLRRRVAALAAKVSAMYRSPG
jgi:predicted DNA-binding transcriptional regulator YafY